MVYIGNRHPPSRARSVGKAGTRYNGYSIRKAASTGNAAQFGMFLRRAYAIPAAASSVQPASSAARKPAGSVAIGLILASIVCATLANAQDPPPDLAKLVAHRETEC